MLDPGIDVIDFALVDCSDRRMACHMCQRTIGPLWFWLFESWPSINLCRSGHLKVNHRRSTPETTGRRLNDHWTEFQRSLHCRSGRLTVHKRQRNDIEMTLEWWQNDKDWLTLQRQRMLVLLGLFQICAEVMAVHEMPSEWLNAIQMTFIEFLTAQEEMVES